jgi:Na+-translocating ferredoxin:NAD+ oxidoreductase RnfA subunit
VKCVLAKQEGQKFNSLEVTKVVSKRFLGIPFMGVTAHSRHIQQGIGLVPAKDFVLRMHAVPNGEVATRQYVALIASS